MFNILGILNSTIFVATEYTGLFDNFLKQEYIAEIFDSVNIEWT